jgi:antitoxin ParD1/3/4
MTDDATVPVPDKRPGGASRAAAPDPVESPEIQAARIAQAHALRAAAAAGGLRFEAYLPPRLAEWVLDFVERGVFADPSEAVFVILGEHNELEPHIDLREELLRRTVAAAIDEPRPPFTDAEIDAQLRELTDKPRPPAAVWRKIP